MRVLALDLSTHCGFAVLEEGFEPKRIASGVVHLNKTVHEFGPYPHDYRAAARKQITNVLALVDDYQPDVVVAEETNPGRNRYTQKLLEFMHYRLGEALTERGLPLVYIDSGGWRHALGLKLSKEQRAANAKLARAKKKAKDAGTKLDKKSLGIAGRVNWKHLSVDYANAAFGLKLLKKQNDEADALCLGLAYLKGAPHCDGV